MEQQPDYSTPEYWNERARDNEGDPRQCLFRDPRFNQYERITYHILKGLIRAGDKVLDVACGYGRFAQTVRYAGGSWYGVDFSEEMKRQAKSLITLSEYGRFQVVDATKGIDLSLKGWGENRFNLIFEVNSLKCLRLTEEEFASLYQPLLRSAGQIACLECDQFTVFNYYGRA
jgi:ubiquinone/menaquinone biosynthesis C-methylase UbiE